MAKGPREYRWEWQLQATPDELWPRVTDTNRFNQEVGLPTVEEMLPSPDPRMGTRRIRLKLLGVVPLRWREEPFEWVRPWRMSVERNYEAGPMEKMLVRLEMTERDDGGTTLAYSVRAWPRGLLGRLILPIELGIKMPKRFGAAFRKCDEEAMAARTAEPVIGNDGSLSASSPGTRVLTAPVSGGRFHAIRSKLVGAGYAPHRVDALIRLVRKGDPMDVHRIRPYVLADRWKMPRRDTLALCLSATREGLLELRWDLLCPLCRGAKETAPTLGEVGRTVHCESCNIDYSAKVEQSVEVTFRPSKLVREIGVTEFCVGGPQVTPHIVAQLVLAPDASSTIVPQLEPGRYRLRGRAIPGHLMMVVAAETGASASLTVAPTAEGWPGDEPCVTGAPELTVTNATGEPEVIALERMAWSDDAATAADVMVLQSFRDLFAADALRPGEQVEVGHVALLFTDLKGSTAMYRDIGDATAFGRVMRHFDVLRAAIDETGGAMVKTIGDAVMAAFRSPADALRAMLHAQHTLTFPPDGSAAMTLKAGVHIGPCIAVRLNGRLDYFGSTVNMAARLEGQSSGGDVVISSEVAEDPSVVELLREFPEALAASPFDCELKGFFGETFRLWRVRLLPGAQEDESWRAPTASSVRLRAPGGR